MRIIKSDWKCVMHACMVYMWLHCHCGSELFSARSCGRMDELIHSLLCVKSAWIHLRTHPFYLFYCDSGNKSPTHPVLHKVNSHWLKRPLFDSITVKSYNLIFQTSRQSNAYLYKRENLILNYSRHSTNFSSPPCYPQLVLLGPWAPFCPWGSTPFY